MIKGRNEKARAVVYRQCANDRARSFSITALFALFLFLHAPNTMAQFNYITNEGSITITGVTITRTNDLVFPTAINGLPVTRIAKLTYLGFPPFVQRVIIPDSITNIADHAFYGWSSVTNVVFGAGLAAIGDDAFGSCNSLKTFTVDSGNSNLSSVDGIVYDKSQSTLILYPGGRLGSFIVPDGVISIGAGAFRSNNNVVSITLPPTVATIGASAFQSCYNLKSVTNATGIANIGDSAFALCQQLPKFPFGNNLTNIGREAFYACGSFTTVSIGSTPLTIGPRAFAYCGKLTSINVDPGNPLFSSLAGALFDKTGATVIQFPPGKSSANYSVPVGVQRIDDFAFSACTKVLGITLPDTVTSIGAAAFADCSALANINLPEGIAEIPTNTFYRCFGLTNIVIPNSVTNIGGAAFASTRLRTLTIPTNVVAIGDRAFNDCKGFSTLVIPDNVMSLGKLAFTSTFLYDVSIGSGLNAIPLGAFASCTYLRSVTMGNNITAIGDSAFSGCFGLPNIALPNSVTNIGSFAFGFTYAFTNVSIPSSVLRIGDQAFYFSSISEIAIPNGVIEIGTNAFERCHSLTNITIPASVAYLGANAFNETTNLRDISVDPLNTTYSSHDGVLFDRDGTLLIHYPHGKTEKSYAIPAGVKTISNSAFAELGALAAITFPNGLLKIGDFAFQRCTNLTELTFPPELESIGFSAFSGCSLLEHIVLSNGPATIAQFAFGGCVGLTNLTIPEGVRTIGSSAFGSCSNVTNVRLPDSLETLSGYAFAQSGLTNISIGRGLANLDLTALAQSFSLLTISVDPQNASFSDIDGVLFNKDQTRLLLYPHGRTGSYTIPDSARNVGDSAFYACQTLTSVTIPAGVTNISAFAFYVCPKLVAVYFRGDRPAVDRNVFWAGNDLTSYYLPQTTGWSSPFADRPAVLWNPTPIVDADFGIHGNSFGFDMAGTTDLVIVVEASDNLTDPQWTPVSTNTLAAGSASFNDPTWQNHPARIYRFRSP